MSEKTKHRSNTISAGTPEDSDAASSLASQRADIDRLFAVASQAFDGLNLGDSQTFLNSSRQTGGQ